MGRSVKGRVRAKRRVKHEWKVKGTKELFTVLLTGHFWIYTESSFVFGKLKETGNYL